MPRKNYDHYNKPENRDLRDIYMLNKKPFNSLGDTEQIYKPKDYSNLYVGIAMGVMIMICAGIFIVMSVIS